jgi:hypothetical protein
MAATVRLSYASSTGPTLASAEGGIKYNREETLNGTTAPVPRPTATGTAFSYSKPFRLEVTGTDATNLSNLRLHYSGAAPATGLALWYRDDGTTYQRGNALAAADSGSNGATPAGYSAMPSSPTQYDSGSYSAGTTGGKGDYFSTALGVSNNYAGGAGSAIALPDLVVTYDES